MLDWSSLQTLLAITGFPALALFGLAAIGALWGAYK
jgi:hypothetical protein